MLLLSLRSAPPRRGVAGWFFLRLSLWLGIAAFLPGLAPLRSARAAEPPDAAQRAALATFFESKIRPVLIDRCVECHGANKQKAGLRLDSAAALKAGNCKLDKRW
jgi:mono/diheme cytochrome c family protein